MSRKGSTLGLAFASRRRPPPFLSQLLPKRIHAARSLVARVPDAFSLGLDRRICRRSLVLARGVQAKAVCVATAAAAAAAAALTRAANDARAAPSLHAPFPDFPPNHNTLKPPSADSIAAILQH